ncbi:MAG TPA: response regulator, partial [Gemmatimonadaceae bacterium]|nr:response regulator [Gemmatimonadaceae bacterium]
MANILIVDDERPLAEALATFFRRTGGHATTCAHTGAEAVERYEAERPDLVLLDFRLPDMTGLDVYSRIRDSDPVVIMITGHADVPLAVEAMQSGVENFLIKPIELSHLAVAADQAFEKVRLRRLAGYLRDHHSNPTTIAIGTSPVMRDLGAQVELLALSDRTTVLVLGEQGSGKGRVAESIHRLGPRRDHPYVEVSCAAMRGDALDSELFGAEAGPDGHRTTRAGLLEVA